jgi:hypothetical protein
MSQIDYPIIQLSLDISPIWTPVITAEIRKLQLRPVQTMNESCAFMFVLYSEFVSLLLTSVRTVLSF